MDPAPTASATDPSWRRTHIASLLLASIGLLPRIVDLIPAIAALGLSGYSHFIPAAIAIYFFAHITAITLKWWRFQYRITDANIMLQSGVFSRHHRSIDFDRIQDISIAQKLLARTFNLADVSIDTGAGASAEGDAITLSAITLAEAHDLREQLRRYRSDPRLASAKQAGDAGQSAVAGTMADRTDEDRAAASGELLFHLSPLRLFLSGMLSPSLAVFAAIAAFAQFSERFWPKDFDPFSAQQWTQWMAAYGVKDWFTEHRLISMVAAVAVIGLFSSLTGLILTLFRDWDYRLLREARTLRRRKGLTHRTDVAITIRRIQSAIITTRPIRRLFGWRELRVRSLSSDIGASGGGDYQIIPFAKRAELDPVLRSIALQPDWQALQWQGSHRLIAAPGIGAGLALVITALFLIWSQPPLLLWGWLMLLLGPLLIVASTLRARQSAIAWQGPWLVIRHGLMRPRLHIIPCRHIQSADIRDNFVYRRFGLATLALGIPGRGRFSDDHVPAIPMELARSLREHILINISDKIEANRNI